MMKQSDDKSHRRQRRHADRSSCSRGFIRILEAIIASVILLSMFSVFLNPVKTDTMWNDAILQNQADDALAALYKSGSLNSIIIKNDDSFYATAKGMLPATTDFTAEVSGIPNPVIGIGCVGCSVAEKDGLRSRLLPMTFKYKNRIIQIIVDDETSLTELLKEPKIKSINVFYFKDYATFDNNRANLNNIINNKKTIILVADLTQQQAEDNDIKNIFGLEWDNNGNPSDRSKFYYYNDVNKTSFKINNYFFNISFRVNTPALTYEGTFNAGDKSITIKSDTDEDGLCVRSPPPSEICYNIGETFTAEGIKLKVYDVEAARTYSDIGIADRDFEFRKFSMSAKIAIDDRTVSSTLPAVNDVSTIKTNLLDGNARAVWLAPYDTAYSDMNQLFKATILWSSGEKFTLRDIPIPATQPLHRHNYIGILDGYEAYEVSLTVWRIFY